MAGSPAPVAKWFKNGKEVKPGPSQLRQHNNLVFVTAKRSDEGVYKCAAETERGTVVSANYTVNVLGKKLNMVLEFVSAYFMCVFVTPACATDDHGESLSLSSTEPVSISEGLTSQLVSPGSSTRFTCRATGNPSPNITWLFNANPITPSHRFQISGSSLVIADVAPQDEGVYQCLLDNGFGSAQSSAVLTTQSGVYL